MHACVYEYCTHVCAYVCMCECVYVRALKDPLLTAGDGIMRAKEGGGRMHAGDARMGRLNPSARPSATRISHPYLSVCPSLRPPDRPLSLGASVRPPDRPLSLGVPLLASTQSTPIFWCVPPCPPHRPLSLGPIVPYVSECPSLRPPHCPLSLGVSLLASTQSSPISRCVPPCVPTIPPSLDASSLLSPLACGGR